MTSDTQQSRRSRDWWTDERDGLGPAMRECLAAAIAAPSVHNTQPWLFRPSRGGVDVYVDRERQLPVIDPAGRELMMSVGAAVFNLRVAILAHGRKPVQCLLPVPHLADLPVRVTVGPPVTASKTVRSLAWAIAQRHSNRWPFTGDPVPAEVLGELADAAEAEGATLRIPGDSGRKGVLGLVAAAERFWRDDAAYRAELAAWTYDLSSRGDGVRAAAFGPRPATAALALRDLGLCQSTAGRACAEFEAQPTIAVLHTADTPTAWLRAGQALERVLLTATVRGLAATLMTQPLEVPLLRDLISDQRTGFPAQAIIRLGYGRRIGPRTQRRPLAEVLYEPSRRAAVA